MRYIFCRHRIGCKRATSAKGKPARQVFGCGCPIYARVEIRERDTGKVLFRYNGCLKGITQKDAAEELVTAWLVKHLAGDKPAVAPEKPAMSIDEAIQRFIAEKQGREAPKSAVKLSDAVRKYKNRSEDSLTIRKLKYLLYPLAAFMKARRIACLKDIRVEDLIEYQGTWHGKKNVDDNGNVLHAPASQVTKQKNQEFIKAFFKRARMLGWVDVNPAELLTPFKVGDPEIKVFTAEEKQRLLELIPQTFPQTAAMVRAFVLVQRFTALRISDMVALRLDSVHGDGIFVTARKNETPVYCALPPVALEALKSITPKSSDHFFWTGTGDIQSACKRWSAVLLRLFRAAGIADKRSHQWRDSMATAILETDEGRLEDAQVALGHKARRTTEKYYVTMTKKRAERATEVKRTLWIAGML